MNESYEAVRATTGRVLGVDFGDARTGLALSDAARFLASSIGQISPGGLDKTAEAVAAVAKEKNAVAIVVGLPVNMDGSEGPRAARTRKFAARLAEFTGLPVAMFDERMTTMTAARFLNDTNTRGARRKGVLDALSAEIILQNFIDRLRNAK
jgi:putative Holliday junction resolvase